MLEERMRLQKGKREENEQFGKKKNQHVNGNYKIFLNENGKVRGGKTENCERIKDRTGRLAVGVF